jgi:hypothetical protein
VRVGGSNSSVGGWSNSSVGVIAVCEGVGLIAVWGVGSI